MRLLMYFMLNVLYSRHAPNEGTRESIACALKDRATDRGGQDRG